MPTADTPLELTATLARRLRPVVLAVGVLLAVSVPSAYYLMGVYGLRVAAGIIASEIADEVERLVAENTDLWRYQTDAILDAAHKREGQNAIVFLRIVDDSGRLVAGHSHAGKEGPPWWDRAAPTETARVTFNNRVVGTIEVRLSQGKLLKFSALLLLLSSGVSVGLSLIVYRFPIGVVRRAEARLLSHVTELRQAQEVLASRTRQLEAVRAVGLEIARALDLPALLDLILQRAADLVGVIGCAVYLLQEEEEEEVFRPISWNGYGDWMKGLRIKRGQGLVGLVAERRQGMIVNDYQTWPLALPEIRERTTVTAAMAEPLILGDRLLGVLVLDNQDMGRPFTSQDQEAVRLFTAQAAIAIANAQQYRQIVTHAARDNAMLRALRSLLSGADFQGRLDGIAAEAARLVDSSIVKVVLVDREAGGLRVQAMTDATSVSLNSLIPIGVGLSGIVAATGEPLFVPDCGADPRNVFGTRDRELGIVTYLGLPIKIGDEVLGVMTLNTTIPRRYSASEMAFLASFAEQAAIAIERSRLHETIRRHAATLEVRVQERTAELERALQVKTDFLANLSHELRTPLNPILGFTELLQEQAGDRLTERQIGYLARIRESGERLLALIETLLDYTSLEVGGLTLKPAPLDLHALLEAATGEIRAQAVAKRLALTLQVAESLPPLVADPLRVRQIFALLLANAVKFTPAGGAVRVTARRTQDAGSRTQQAERSTDDEAAPAASLLPPADWLEIAVADTGIGITAEDLPKLFTPFTQLEEVYTKQYQGVGMGLALAKRLVELHGGRIWAESAGPGQGARFIVHLPLRAIPRPKRILVVEDEAPVLEFLVAALASAGYAVEQAERGAQALAALAVSPPDLLVLDIGLPDVDGWEILKQVRGAEHTRDLRILVLTGLEHVNANQALALGADEFLTKPVSPRVLLETVGYLFRQASLATLPPG